MVKAEFFTNKESGSITMNLSGHAGQAERGNDIVCAAASILAYTVAQALQFQYEDGGLRKKPHIKLEPGDTVIIAKPIPERYEETLHTFFIAQVGYSLLAKTYPQYVELSSFGEAEHK